MPTPIPATAPVLGLLAPKNYEDAFPVYDFRYALGGFRSVGVTLDLLIPSAAGEAVDPLTPDRSITSARRKRGMMVYVEGVTAFYGLFSSTGDAAWEVVGPRYFKGGFRSLGTTAEMEAIRGDMREEGMVVYVSGRTAFYALIGTTANSGWTTGFTFGSGGGGGIVGNYVSTFNGRTGDVTGASLGANTFNGRQDSASGFSGPLFGNATTATTATQVSSSLSAGHLLTGGPFNGSGAVTLNSTGASLGANTFSGVQSSTSGFSGPLNGNATTATTATQVSSSLSAGHLLTGGPFNGSGAVTLNSTGASLGANTFTGVNSFNLGLTSAASYFSGNVTVGANGTVLNTNGDVTIGRTLTVNGNMYIDGTLTTVNRVDLEIDDAFIVLGRTLNTDALLDNAGIWLGVSGSSQNATSRYLRWQNSELAWQSSNNFNVPSGGAYEVNGVNVLATNQVHGLSFSSSATISAGTWQGGVIGLAYGGTNKDLSAVGVSGGIVFKDGAGISVLGTTGSASQVLIGSANGLPTWTNLGLLTGISASRINITSSSDNSSFELVFADYSSAGNYQLRANPAGLRYNPFWDTLTCGQIEATIDGGVWT